MSNRQSNDQQKKVDECLSKGAFDCVYRKSKFLKLKSRKFAFDKESIMQTALALSEITGLMLEIVALCSIQWSVESKTH